MSSYLPLLLFLAFLLLIDWYLFQGVRTATATLSSGRVRLAIHSVYWLANFSLIGLLAFSLLTIDRAQGIKPVFLVALNFFILLFVPKLVFLFVLGAEDLYRFVCAILSRAYQFFFDAGAGGPAAESFLPARRHFISQAGIALAGLVFGSFVYGMTRGKYAYRVHRQTVFFPDLPEAFDGFRITQLSDIHAGSFGDAAEVRRGVALANAQESDLMVFTGDMVNNEAVESRSLARRLRIAPGALWQILGLR